MKFLRLSVLLLIFANLLLFAWGQGYLGARDTGREPERLEAQKSPEKLHVVANGADASSADEAPAADSSGPECRRIAGFAAKPIDAKQWMAAAQEKLPKAKFNLIPGTATFDVAIIGLRGNEGAEAKLQELKKLGIDLPAKTVKETADRVSLVFITAPTEAEAKNFLGGLNAKGVRTARVVPHPAQAQVEITGADAAQLKDLLAANETLRAEECPAQ